METPLKTSLPDTMNLDLEHTPRTKQRVKTLYRECACGENAHDLEAARLSGTWVRVYVCRNCRSVVVGPVMTALATDK